MVIIRQRNESRGYYYLAITGLVLMLLAGNGLLLSAIVSPPYNSNAVWSSLDALQNFFTCSKYTVSWFGSSGPPCLFKGNSYELLGTWVLFSTFLAGILFVSCSLKLRAFTAASAGTRMASSDKLMTFSLTCLIILLGSFVLFYAGDINSNIDGLVSNFSGYRLEGWLNAGYNRLLVEVTGAILMSGTIGFLTIRAVSKFNSIVLRIIGNKINDPKQLAFFSRLTAKPSKRGLAKLFLLSTLIVGTPVWILSNQPIREYIRSIEPHGLGPLSTFFSQYFLGVIFLVDVARMFLLLAVVRRLKNVGRMQNIEHTLT